MNVTIGENTLNSPKTVDDQPVVSIDRIAELTGFPTHLIMSELDLKNGDASMISMNQLRNAVLKYVDKTFSN